MQGRNGLVCKENGRLRQKGNDFKRIVGDLNMKERMWGKEYGGVRIIMLEMLACFRVWNTLLLTWKIQIYKEAPEGRGHLEKCDRSCQVRCDLSFGDIESPCDFFCTLFISLPVWPSGERDVVQVENLIPSNLFKWNIPRRWRGASRDVFFSCFCLRERERGGKEDALEKTCSFYIIIL